MCCGLYSILWTIRERFTTAAWLILLAIVFDGFDGYIARSMKTTSRIGIELDSFSDFVSFCIAPAILIYSIILWQYRTPGLAVSLIYIFFGALRLSRFNVKAHKEYDIATKMTKPSTYYIEGLPVPGAAGILASLILSFELFEKFEQGITRKAIPILIERIPFLIHSIPVIMIILSFFMISKMRYTSLSRLKITKRISLRTFLLIIVAILLILSYPENMIFIIFSLYLVSGLIDYFVRFYLLHTSKRNIFIKENEK
jgi:CDP-diacylglycerol--serine O-phosphatidyltransferase